MVGCCALRHYACVQSLEVWHNIQSVYWGSFGTVFRTTFHVRVVVELAPSLFLYITTCLPKRCLPRRSTSSVSDRLTLPHSITPTLTRGSTLTFDQRSKQKQANTQIIKNKSDGVVIIILADVHTISSTSNHVCFQCSPILMFSKSVVQCQALRPCVWVWLPF